MLTWLLTGGLTAPMLMVGGAFFLIYLRGYPFRTPRRMAEAVSGKGSGEGSPRRALMQALAGTLGVGNLVGVAGAIRIGGPGAVFWMWASAILAMILKYAEILLAVSHCKVEGERRCGGAFYYIKEAFQERHLPLVGMVIASLFAVLMLLNSLTMGCVIQVNAVVSAAEQGLHLSPYICGILLCILTVPLLFTGRSNIAALTDILVPLMTVGYLILSTYVLFLRRDGLGEAFCSVFRSAFSSEAAVGGAFGFLTSRALRVGTMRGILSNEAGCGTSPTAHAGAQNHPAYQGVWGILEVAVDTLLLCTVSAMVILTGEDPALFGGNDILICMQAYSLELGRWAEVFFSLAVASFGYATLICWGSYGLESLKCLTPRPLARIVYLLAFTIAILIGTCPMTDAVWNVSDFCIAAMTAINLPTLLLLRRKILNVTLQIYGKSMKK